MDGAVPGAAPDTITTPGGKRLQSISAFEIQQAMGRMPSVKVLAAATTVLDQLHEMDSGWVFALRGRPFSRSIRAILEYYNLRDGDLTQLVWILAYYDKAGAFFSLAAPSNDDGLKEYLLGAGVSWEQVVLHYELSLWDPVRAAAGFVVGLGASFAAILESLKELFDPGLMPSTTRRRRGQSSRNSWRTAPAVVRSAGGHGRRGMASLAAAVQSSALRSGFRKGRVPARQAGRRPVAVAHRATRARQASRDDDEARAQVCGVVRQGRSRLAAHGGAAG
jgi:hypothetical protein